MRILRNMARDRILRRRLLARRCATSLLACPSGSWPTNRSFDMNNKYGKFLVHGLLITALTFGSFVSDAGADDGLMVHQAGGLPYVSGGVGEESLQQLKDHVSEFNLKLVFAMTSGSYLSDVRVAIADAKGKTLLEATSDGPWFLAKLPGGRYRVVASYAGKAIERSIAVDAKALKTVDFR